MLKVYHTKYRFKLRCHQHRTSKIVFCSPWFDAGDSLEAIAKKDNYLAEHPEFRDCWVKWENK